MATLQAQVEGLTSLSVGTTPTTAELSEFLKDGVIDVTNRWLLVRPQDIFDFAAVSGEQTGNGLDLGGATVLSVIREAGVNDDWRDCRQVSPGMQSRVVDGNSLHYASKYNPAYMEFEDGKVSVFPDPGTDPNAFKVYYVNNVPIQEDGDPIDQSSTDIKNFPLSKVYLVILYAGIKSLQANLGAMGISTFSLSASAPGAPSVATVSYSVAANSDAGATAVTSTSTASVIAKADISGNPPSYTAPVFTSTSTYLTEMEAGTIGAAASDIDIEHWFSIAGQLIEDEEDTELAQVHLQKISTFLSAFQADMQNQLNIFNDQNATYQANVQAEIAKHNTDLQVAITNANNVAREYMQEAQQATDIDKFNKAQDQALDLANKAKTMEAIVANNSNILADFGAELQKYQALVASDVQKYQQEIAEKSTEYQWMSARLKDLKEEYDRAFLLAAPKQQQANA